ncbi:methyltransferase domain-containing protein [archaeon]
MKLVLQLSRQDPALAKAEAESLFPKATALHGELLLVEGDAKLLSRLVMTRFAGKLLTETNTCKGLRLPAYKSFAVRVSRVAGKESSSEIINAVAGQVKGKVDLETPNAVIRLFTDGKKYWVTEQLYEYSPKSFAERDVNARMVFHPTSLQPKYGRLLVNLTGVKKGKVLDPFCGVGGILLEAADFGLAAQGIEISEEYAEGARENAWFYRMEKKVQVDQSDFLEWKGGKFDAIVSDLPYGKSSGLFGKNRDELYLDAFKKMKTHSKKLVVMAHSDLKPLLKKAGWKTTQWFEMYVHKSMRRYIHVASA